ncbi:MAG: Riboflavin synthase eubacterial/eukaryotic (EC [uncultured Caballeronia sp.]|nr:MAG: Riboflavin synthase eubacterial/eukaryotic (EC [uncultured Caballeronia sp.]
MFTGIVAAVGRIEAVTPLGSATDTGVRLTVASGGLDLADVELGDSISIQGACMTVIEKSAGSFAVDVSRESLSKAAGLSEPGDVNLEKALRAHDRLGGHLVSGHVDGLGEVTHFAPVGESHELRILASCDIGKYLAYKGSVTVNGVSLTVNTVNNRPDGCEFSINLIPHTVEVTTLRHLNASAKVNLEIDLIARYVERILSTSADSHQAAAR